MIRLYFDTSGINRLLADPVAVELIQQHPELETRVSIYTFAELASTSTAEERNALVGLARDLTDGVRPLAMPGDLLKRSVVAFQKSLKSIDATMDDEWDGVWVGLQDPDKIDDEALQEIREWKKEQETWYNEMHTNGKPLLQAGLDSLPDEERAQVASFPGVLRHFYENRKDFVTELFYDALKDIDGNRPAFSTVQRALFEVNLCRYYLGAMAYGLWVRSIRKEKYGKRYSSSIDTQQAVYLSACDIFVTADVPQRDMLKRITRLVKEPKRRIMGYCEFRRWLESMRER